MSTQPSVAAEVVADLAAHAEGTTARDIAARLGRGYSTVGKALNALESDGQAHRLTGGDHQTPARWFPHGLDATVSPQDPPAIDIAGTGGDGNPDTATISTSDSTGESGTEVDSEQAAPSGTAVTPDEPEPGNAARGKAAAAPAKDTSLTLAGQPRLGKGGLEKAVAAFFADHPGEDFSPYKVGQHLDRSPGAVHNAIGKLCVAGDLTKAGDSPARYRHARS
ncbi:MAG: hypothetical protein ACRD0P_30385 [Stackebrandtia sp.]